MCHYRLVTDKVSPRSSRSSRVSPSCTLSSKQKGQWYEEPNGAKFLCKKNTFNDFVDVARYLIESKKLTTPELLSCEGRSAGGMLIGSTLNQAPELFKVAIMGVPFCDVLCTMCDASIRLTTNEVRLLSLFVTVRCDFPYLLLTQYVFFLP
jgi:hypothetical protein